MTREELIALHEQMTTDARALIVRKNADYAGAENAKDAFRNFRRHGAFGICVRLGDKLARMDTFVERGSFEIANEGTRDTCIDIINYAVLLYGMLMESKSS